MPEMLYATIPYVKKKVSRILFGTAFPPVVTGGDGSALFEKALSAGINTFDIARNYLYAERSIGNWLEQSGKRNEVVLLTKCGHPSVFDRKRVNEKDMRNDLEKSLRELKTDYIDIYLLHRDDIKIDAGIAVEVFNAMYAEGKIGAFGGSNWTSERIEQANEYAYKRNLIPFTVSSPNFGLARQVQDPWGGGCTTISGLENEASRAWYQKNQMPVIAYSSLGRGLFAGVLKSSEQASVAQYLDAVAMKGYASPDNFERLRRAEILAQVHSVTVAQIALNWIFTQNLNTFAVVSMTKEELIDVNIAALHVNLSESEAAYLNLQKEAL